MLVSSKITKKTLEKAFRLMSTAKTLTELYEERFKTVSKYVHATSRGHEAIQIATGILLKPQDFLSPYYRDDSFLLSIGMTPYHLMLQLFAKKDDPFSGGRSYYCHPSLRDEDKTKIITQTSATGMQAIPASGIAMGIQYKEKLGILDAGKYKENPVVVCSLGDASITEGEVAEAFQMTALRQFPIIFLVQDNEWNISAHLEEFRAMTALEYIQGFPGIEGREVDGSDFLACYETMKDVVDTVRIERRPFLVHATVPLLNHHTSGVRMEWYRDDLEEHRLRDPYPLMKELMFESGFTEKKIKNIEHQVRKLVERDFQRALAAEDPLPQDIFKDDFAPTPIREESGTRVPKGGEEKVMVDSALYAIEELMRKHKECLLYGQDVGARLGGVFREAATLAQKFGDDRVFNTPIQEAFIVGSTVGMSAVGLKPIVEVQFADYIWPGLNQLFTEVSRSCYLSNGKWPVSMILRVPIGAYGSGGPFHSSSVESVVVNIKGLKVAYPSNGADLKGLMKAAYYDPNPCVIFEHKGLYWSKVKGTHRAKTIMPGEDYILPFGKGHLVLDIPNADKENCVLIVTYGMGVHWALNAASQFPGKVGVIDLRTLFPLDSDLIVDNVRRYNKCIVLTEECINYSFTQSLAGRIQENCFESLDAPIKCIGSENLPAIPINTELEKAFIPSVDKVAAAIETLLKY